MLKTFTYTKESGDVSMRTVYPLNVVDDKLFVIDLTQCTDAERHEYKILLDAVHKQYIDSVKKAVGSDKFRLFFMSQIS